MNELTIRQKIYEIRGQRVMLDFDLAALYGVETAQLKRQVRRNIERFEGEDFMFEMTHDELLRCQIGTSGWAAISSQFVTTSTSRHALNSMLLVKRWLNFKPKHPNNIHVVE